MPRGGLFAASLDRVRVRRTLPFCLVAVAVCALQLAGAFEFFERRWLDLRFRLISRPASRDVVLVEIDPRSLQQLDLWPWPRGYHATVLEELFDAGARRVGIDINFSSRSDSEEEDAALRDAILAAGSRVVLPVFKQWQHTALETAHHIDVAPLPELQPFARLGSINIHPESDGLVWSYAPRDDAEGRLVSSFAAALADDVRPEIDRFQIDFGIRPNSIPRISYVDVLTGSYDRSLIAGRVVILGATAVELGDQVAVPVFAALPGPHLQALAYESLTHGRALQRSGTPLALLGILAIACGLGPWLVALPAKRAVALTAAMAAALFVLAFAVQYTAPVILEISGWQIALFSTCGCALIRRSDQQARGLVAQGALILRTENLMRHVVENSFDAVLTIDESGIIETANRSAQQMFGLDERELVGRPFTQLLARDDEPSSGSLLVRATATPIEARGRHVNGGIFPLEIVITVLDGADETKLVACLRDITERKAHQQALEHQATHDPLTDLPNRFLLMDRLRAALDGRTDPARTAAILLLDLDRFKEINDALGHHTGDRLLQQVARRLQMPLNPEDTIARLGGDEFAVHLPGSDLEQARRVSYRLIEALRSPFKVDGLSLQIDTSIGIAMYPIDGTDPETLIQRADVAMYVAKRKRSGLSTYEPDQDYNSVRNLMLKGDLRYAIQDDLLFLAFQPKISAETNCVLGVEALLRWQHPKHGMISPDEFIGLAEHSGLIRPLTQWVLDTALKQAAAWRAAGHPLQLSINISARNLLEEDLPRTLDRLLRLHRLPPPQLTLEITESVLMEDPERSLQVITRLHELGVVISIDDFGTGYSSLAYLMRLPASEVKIDRSFVIDMERDGSNAMLVRSIIDLAHNLNLRVVAEGVENAEVWQALRALDCDVGQGYHFSRPLRADALLAWVDAFDGAALDAPRSPGIDDSPELVLAGSVLALPGADQVDAVGR